MRQLVLPLIGTLFGTVVIAIIARFVLLPVALALPDNFEYRANVLSLDNFYDEKTKNFLGEDHSVTTFSYHVGSSRNNTKLVQNIFDVRTTAGEKIIQVQREYGINRFSWMHDPAAGDRERNGYLFAPRQLKKGESFTYWHVNYDMPLQMTYVGEENIGGLLVRQYTSRFTVDQTASLGHLPGVPAEKGVNVDVSFSLWIEPTSGWLVKYADSAIAYYYNQKTKDRLNPWNKFHNSYSYASVLDQVKTAQKYKNRILLFEGGLPLAFMVVCAVLVVMRSRSTRRLMAVPALVGLVIFAGAIWFNSLPPSQPERMFRIGISRWVVSGNSEYDRNIQGFKDALMTAGYLEGKNILFDDQTAAGNPEKQKEISQKFTRDNYDLIYSLTTPGTLILKEQIPHRPIVFSIVTYPLEVGIVKSLKHSGNNLVGTRNWVSEADQIAVLKEIIPTAQKIGFLHRRSEPNSTIQLEKMRQASAQSGIQVIEIDGTSLTDLIQNLKSRHGEFDVLYSACDTLIQAEAEQQIIALAHEWKLPSFTCSASGTESGDLFGVFADFYEIGRLAGEQAALILDGASPESLQTNIVSRPFIYLNAKTADLLGITLPQVVTARAKRIIR